MNWDYERRITWALRQAGLVLGSKLLHLSSLRINLEFGAFFVQPERKAPERYAAFIDYISPSSFLHNIWDENFHLALWILSWHQCIFHNYSLPKYYP